MTAYCIIGFILFTIVVAFFAWSLCVVAARADTDTMYRLDELERDCEPKVTGEI
jgi:hypothetical protein